MPKLINLYGGTGTIGSVFFKRYEEECNLMARSRVYTHIPGPILYLISTTHNYNIFDKPHDDVDTNLTWLIEVMESWRKNHPQEVFNFVSSWFVYGDGYDGGTPNWNPYVGLKDEAYEYSECRPKGWYSITKRCAEQMLISYCQTYGLKYRIFRLGNVIAPADKGVSAQKNALQYLINKMKAGEEIEVYEEGNFYRNYMGVQDCVEAMHFLLKNGKENEIYNVGGQNVKFIDMLMYAKKEIGYKKEFKFIPQKDFHKIVQAKTFVMNTDKLKALGWKPRLTVNQALDTVIYNKNV